MSYTSENHPIPLAEMKDALRDATWAHNRHKLTKWRRLLRTAIRTAEELETVSRQLREANLRQQRPNEPLLKFSEPPLLSWGSRNDGKTLAVFMPSRQAGKTHWAQHFIDRPRNETSPCDVLHGDAKLSAVDLESAGMEGTETPEVDWSKFLLPREVAPRQNAQNLRVGQVWTYCNDELGKSVYRITEVLDHDVKYQPLAGYVSHAGFATKTAPRIINAVMVADERGRWEPGFSAAGIAGEHNDFDTLTQRQGWLSPRDNIPNIKVGQSWLRQTPMLLASVKYDTQVVRFTRDLGDRFEVRIVESQLSPQNKNVLRIYRKDRLQITMSRAVLLSGSTCEPQYLSPQESTTASSSRAA